MRHAGALALIAIGVVACASPPHTADRALPASPDLEPWRQFVEVLRTGNYPAGDIRPYQESLRQPMADFLEAMSRKADWQQWRRPKIFRESDELHFVLPLTFDGQTATYSFSFVREGDRWHFQHLEAISLPMYRLEPLPARVFPDIPEMEKAWIREELEVSQEVRLFNTLKALEGTAAALDWFKDGPGYALAARAWIPYVSQRRALVLYLCWEQANLRGNEVVLEELGEDRAVVKVKPRYFQLYERAAHLKQQITPELYGQLYETRWQSRASAAGWKLNLLCVDGECTFSFVSDPEA